MQHADRASNRCRDWRRFHPQKRWQTTCQCVPEASDLYAIVFAGVASALMRFGVRGAWPLQWIGAGMTLHGALYFVAHDGMVHRRWPLRWTPRSGYLTRLYQAQRLHPAVQGRDGCVSFGFLWAPSPQRLKRQLQAAQTRRAGQRRTAGDGV